MAFLLAENGPEVGRRYYLTGSGCIMGRHPDCEIVVDASAVSRHHAQIIAEGGRYYVEDLQSRNGTYLNDQLIQGRHGLRDGDVVRVCDIAFTFREDEPAVKPPLGATVGSTGKETILIDDEVKESSSTIMSKLDMSSSSHGRVQLAASPQVKLEALVEITRALGKALALDEVLPGVLDSLFKIFIQADRGFIVMRSKDGALVPMWTKVRRQDSDDTIRISRTIIRQVMKSKEAILSADAASDERFEMSQSIADFRIRSMMCAPLLDSEGNAMGVLQIDTVDQHKRFQQEDLEVLGSVAAQAGIAVDNAQLHEEALKQRALQRDLEVAREVQRGFLPRRAPQLQGYEFFDYYQPAQHVGGDYYDYILLPDGRVAVIVADVVGHGIAAALLMAKLAAEARFCLASEPQVAAATARLNEAITGLQLERFITLVLAVLDPATHQVTIVNAGHMAPVYRKASGQLAQPSSQVAGLPIGINMDVEYQAEPISLAAGESLTMYTDGIYECCNARGEMYGISRLCQRIAEAAGNRTESLGRAIIEDVLSFKGSQPQDDDMCLVSFGRL